MCKDLHLNKVLYCFEADSDAVAVRAQAPIISRMIPLGDSQLIYIGSYDTDTNKLIPDDCRVVSWDCYKFPENPLKKGTPILDSQHTVENK